MTLLAHILLFALSACVMWLLSGVLIDATDTVARRYRKSGFAVAFFVLGFLTSIGEMSVLVSASAGGVPQVSAGNLLGASVVIILLIIPVLAIFGNGIQMARALHPSTIALLLGVVLLPSLLTLDGTLGIAEGFIMIFLYATIFFLVQKRHPAEQEASEAIQETERMLLHKKHATLIDCGKIAIGGILIFLSGIILVEESVYFATILHIPFSFVGLLLLSIGTNVPEFVIAVRCVLGRHKDIAFGDYMGSAAANTFLFGLLAVANGPFHIEASETRLTFIVFAIGAVLFFLFSRTRGTLSRKEGLILLSLFLLFMTMQIGNAVRLSDETRPMETLTQAILARSKK
ncbi:MAG: hypothetical protein PHH13_05805 [Candidatus Peribacteraceae bacterium]|nr:hypothetical protein [Candidatus Peribacteraceae bacterium]